MEYNELNDDWINNFEKTDKLYQDFYKDDLYYIHLKMLYINTNNEIEKIKQETFLMSIPNYISREELLQILKIYSSDTNREYSLLSILKYNMTLEPYHLHHFLKKNGTKDTNIEYGYLTSLKNIDAITFLPCIYMFQDLNDLFILFYQKPTQELQKSIKNGTKKIYIKNHIKNKTIRNTFKDI